MKNKKKTILDKITNLVVNESDFKIEIEFDTIEKVDIDKTSIFELNEELNVPSLSNFAFASALNNNSLDAIKLFSAGIHHSIEVYK